MPNEKLKILYVITKSNWGGAQRYVFDLATMLPRDSFEPTVALGGNGPLKDRLIAAGIPVIPIKNLERDVNFWKDLGSFFELWKIFRREKPNVVHLNSSKSGGLGTLAARLASIPRIIFTVHGWPFNEDRSVIFKIITKFLSWITSLLVTDLIILSEKELRQTASLPFATRKATQIYLGINPTAFLPQTEVQAIIAAKINKPADFFKGKTVIGTISELHPNKGLEFAIRAIALLCNPSVIPAEAGIQNKFTKNNLAFIVIGTGELETELKNLVQKLHLTDTVFFTGFIENADRLLKAFDIFTLTSLKEGLPYAVLEAGAAGVPIIASAVGGIPEVINSENCGNLTTPKDTAAIAAALAELIANPILHAQKSAALQARLASTFTPQQMLERTLNLYRN